MSERQSSTAKKVISSSVACVSCEFQFLFHQRCQRISNFQKRNLVSLVQNFFIRSVGHYSNVNFDEINVAHWERMASILNSMGPSKTGRQWKNVIHIHNRKISADFKKFNDIFRHFIT